MYKVVGFDANAEGYIYCYDTNTDSIKSLDVLDIIHNERRSGKDSSELGSWLKDMTCEETDNGLYTIGVLLKSEMYETNYAEYFCICNQKCYSALHKSLSNTLKARVKLKFLGMDDTTFDEEDYFLENLDKISKKENICIIKGKLLSQAYQITNLVVLVDLDCLHDLFYGKVDTLYFLEKFRKSCLDFKDGTSSNDEIQSHNIMFTPIYDSERNKVFSMQSYFLESAGFSQKSNVVVCGYSDDEDALYLILKGCFNWTYGTSYNVVRYSFKRKTYRKKLEQLYGFDIDKFIKEKKLIVLTRGGSLKEWSSVKLSQLYQDML